LLSELIENPVKFVDLDIINLLFFGFFDYDWVGLIVQIYFLLLVLERPYSYTVLDLIVVDFPF